MKLKQGYSAEIIHQNVESMLADGTEEKSALKTAVDLARKMYKQNNPNIARFPEHLSPQNVVKAFNVFKEKKEKRSSKGGGMNG